MNDGSQVNIYIVRHAEKAQVEEGNRDPLLSYCGQQRARALVNWFSGKPIEAVYATSYQRTQRTGRPLAQDRGLVVETYDARDSQALVDLVRAKQENVLIIGHSNTAPVIANLLAGTELELLDESEFDKLYHIEMSNDQATLREVNQGFVCNDA